MGNYKLKMKFFFNIATIFALSQATSTDYHYPCGNCLVMDLSNSSTVAGYVEHGGLNMEVGAFQYFSYPVSNANCALEFYTNEDECKDIWTLEQHEEVSEDGTGMINVFFVQGKAAGNCEFKMAYVTEFEWNNSFDDDHNGCSEDAVVKIPVEVTSA